MTDPDLAWAVERACLNAWPAPRQVLLGDFVLRAAGGPSRRINSVSPLRNADPTAVIEAAERIYAGLGQPLVFRVPGIATAMDGPLAARGFKAVSETCTLFTRLEAAAPVPDAGVALTAEPTAAWLALRSRLNNGDAVADRVVRGVVDGIALPKGFAAVSAEGELAAIAFGVVQGELLVIEAVGTEPAARGRGFARRAVAGVMTWGRQQGAVAACLQVAADNAPGRRLYERLGFRTDLYRYVYRSRPAAV